MLNRINVDALVEQFMRKWVCKGDGRMCSGQFDVDDVRLSFRALSSSEMEA